MERRMNVDRRPNRVGPTNAIREFFANNPDEELTAKDVEVKFGVSTAHSYYLIGRLSRLGELAFRKEGRLSIYRRAS